MESKDNVEAIKYDFRDRDEHSSLISPCIEPLYKLVLDPLIVRYRLRLSNRFWYSLSFGLFSLIIYIFGINYEIPALFFLLAVLFFVSENSRLIRGKLLPKRTEITTKFVSEINNQQISDILKFLRNYSFYLTTDDLISVIHSKHGTNPSLHYTIIKYQIIYGEFIEYLVNSRYFEHLSSGVLIGYLKRSIDCVSTESYNGLRTYYSGNKQVIKALNVCFPSFLEGHRLFSYFARLRVRIREGFNYGSLDGFLSVIALFFSLLGFADFLMTRGIHITPEDLLTAFGYMFSAVILAMFIFIVLKLGVKLLLYVYREFLMLTAPSSTSCK